MEVTSELVGKVHVVTVSGDLDASNSQHFKNFVLPLLSSPIKLLIDLAKVPFLDSSGMGAMITCQRAATAAGSKMKLCCLSEQVRSSFGLIRLNQMLDIADSREDALRKFIE